MPTLPETRIAKLLEPFLAESTSPGALYQQLGVYLDLLLRWNARTNLTAIRHPEEIVRRHFGESLFAGERLRGHQTPTGTLLDFGSGAGFPGLPIQLVMPNLQCCLAESQGKKAAFLRECARTLGLATEIWPGRTEDMPEFRKFDCVTLRAVDRMDVAITTASERMGLGGIMAILGSGSEGTQLPRGLSVIDEIPVPDSHSRMLYLYRCG